MAKTKRKKIKRLTPEQKKAIWKPSEANAGAGWEPKYGHNIDPRNAELGTPYQETD